MKKIHIYFSILIILALALVMYLYQPTFLGLNQLAQIGGAPGQCKNGSNAVSDFLDGATSVPPTIPKPKPLDFATPLKDIDDAANRLKNKSCPNINSKDAQIIKNKLEGIRQALASAQAYAEKKQFELSQQQILRAASLMTGFLGDYTPQVPCLFDIPHITSALRPSPNSGDSNIDIDNVPGCVIDSLFPRDKYTADKEKRNKERAEFIANHLDEIDLDTVKADILDKGNKKGEGGPYGTLLKNQKTNPACSPSKVLANIKTIESLLGKIHDLFNDTIKKKIDGKISIPEEKQKAKTILSLYQKIYQYEATIIDCAGL